MSLKPFVLAGVVAGLGMAAFAQDQPYQNAQYKAQQDALKREAAQQQAVIDADIVRNPNGKNAQAARAAKEAADAAAAQKAAADAKAKAAAAAAADPKAIAKAKEEAKKAQDEQDKLVADAAAAQAKSAADTQAKVDKWRASGKSAPAIMVTQRSDGSVAVMVGSKLSIFKTAAEANAFVEKTRQQNDTTLSY